MRHRQRGFTFIELLMTLLLIGITFVPMLNMFGHGLNLLNEARKHQTAIDLALEELDRIELEDLSSAELRALGTIEQPTRQIDGADWKVHRIITTGSDPLEMRIRVFMGEELEKPEFELVTYINDLLR